MKIVVFILTGIIIASVCFSQTGDNKDSLLLVLKTAKEDTNKVRTLIRVADIYETNNQDSSNYYLEQSRKLSESLKYTRGIYLYYAQVAIVSYTQGDYSKAMEETNIALRLARELKDSSFVIAMLNNMGIISAFLGKFEDQLNYTLQVKNAVEAIKDSAKYSPIYHSLANCYYNLKQYRRAIEYMLLSVKIYQDYKKRNDYINRVYASLAQNYDALHMTDSALYYYDISLKESVRLHDDYAEATIYGYKADLFGNRYQFDEMLKASEKSLSLAKALQSRQMVASALYTLAYAKLLNGNSASAKKDVLEALEIATKDTLRDELKNAYTVLSYIAAKDGDFKTSVWAKRVTDSIAEAILNQQVIESTTELEKKYETEKKDKQIKLQQAQLQKRRILNNVLIGSAVTFLVISLLVYRNYSQKQKLQEHRIGELEKEKQLMATEAVLKGEEQERTRLAKDLHDGLGGMLSGIKYSFNSMKGNLVMTPDNAQAFERSMDMLDSSIHEMRRIAHNMMPESLVKFGLETALEDFCNEITQSRAINVIYQPINLKDASIDDMTAITIYRIVQELINNILKHSAAKTAIVQVAKTGSQLSVTVEDDGKGFDASILRHSKGIGWQTIQNRVEFLKGKLDITSQTGKGTSVHFEISV